MSVGCGIVCDFGYVVVVVVYCVYDGKCYEQVVMLVCQVVVVVLYNVGYWLLLGNVLIENYDYDCVSEVLV